MKDRAKQLQPKTVEDLTAGIDAVWEKLDQGILDKLVLGFTSKVDLAVKAKG
jgi:hypothetical protein